MTTIGWVTRKRFAELGAVLPRSGWHRRDSGLPGRTLGPWHPEAIGVRRLGAAFTPIAGLAHSRLGLTSNGLEVSVRPLRCPHCGAGPFKTAGELQAHIDAVHGNQQ